MEDSRGDIIKGNINLVGMINLYHCKGIYISVGLVSQSETEKDTCHDTGAY